MWEGLVIWAVLSIIHIVEAKLETYVIELKNPYISDYSILNRKEHFWSAVLAGCWFAVMVPPVIHFKCYWILPALLVNRRIFFDFGLILFMDWEKKVYGGNDWWRNNFFVPIFGKNGRLKELIAAFVITALSISMLFI